MAKAKTKSLSISPDESIIRKIHLIREQKVMLDFDLAALYEVETKYLKRQVRRNIERFPEDFMLELTIKEFKNLRSQIGTSSWGGIRFSPMAFTEQGIAMLSGVVNSSKAISMNIAIMRAFVEIRKVLINNKMIVEKLQMLDNRIGEHDAQLNSIYEAIENLLDEKTDKELEKEKWLKRKRIGFKSEQKN